jgi:hypothetical protein
MAELITPGVAADSKIPQSVPVKSPFYSRAYGGYTTGQEEFYLGHIGNARGKRIMDPMGGQGFLLADLAFRGASVWLGDINPAMCLMSSMRAPEMIRNRERLANWLDDKLKNLGSIGPQALRSEYVDDWLPTNIKAELQSYRQLFDLSGDPFRSAQAFWRMPLRRRFAAVIPLLAAREITCFRSSDNYTWIKPGGLQRELHIIEPLRRAISSWLEFANGKSGLFQGSATSGELHLQRMDAVVGDFGAAPKVHAVITSPPYANRLDYTRMWGPESQVAASIWDANVSDIQAQQIGSNVIKGTKSLVADEGHLPKEIARALAGIKSDEGYASEGYYYPFFRNYAVTLAKSVQKLSTRITKDGILIFFVRDTVRKDILFPTGSLIEGVMTDAGFKSVGKERQIVKRHVGLRRRATSSGLYGVGQQEWWLAFRRPR